MRHSARRTTGTYEQWVHRFLRFHGLKPPREMGQVEINAYLTLGAAAPVWPRARDGSGRPHGGGARPGAAATPGGDDPPAEVQQVLGQLEGTTALVAGRLYGSGLRLMKALRLRVQDLDFGHRQITVRSGKGDKDRLTLMPERLIAPAGEGRRHPHHPGAARPQR